ncbi:MAG TPA: PAS domain S-box protein [Thermoanaerobaculia bacterium]|jgi:PAS domain S-box-containing protein|nr:PAS domain S-box protein [Thermoanaerobaculia bacterium]
MRSPVVAYGGTLSALAAAVLLRWLLDPVLGDSLPLVTLFGAVAGAVWLGGYRPALLAVVLGYFACDYLFIEPRGTFALLSARNLVGLLAYLATCAIIVGFGESLRLAHRRADEGRELLRVTFASIGDAVITTDTEGRITCLNAVAQSLTGWRQSDALGQPLDTVFRIVNEQTREAVENPAIRVLRDGVIVGLANHTVLVAKDGTEQPIDDSASPIRDAQGRLLGCVLIFRDITARRKAEEALRRTEERTRSVVNNVIDGIITIDERGVVQSFNPAAERLFGYSASEAIGQNVSILMPEPYHHEHDDYLRNYLRTGEAKIIGIGREVVGRRKEGSTFPMELAVSEFSLGGRRHFTGIVRDITERKKAERLLRESETRFRQLADAMPQIVWTARPDGYVDYFNERWYEYTGFPRGEYGQQSWEPILHPDDVQRCADTYFGSIKAEKPYQIEYRFKDRRSGGYRWFLGRAVPVRDEQDHIIRWFGTCTDIDDTKRAEEMLKEADRRKNEFLATLAHELRNPLAPIRNAVQILLVKGPPLPDLQWARQVIDRQVRQMARLLDDLLDVSRISHGMLDLRKERVELAAVVQSAVETSRPLIDGGGHELTVDLPAEPVYLDADPVRLAQIFSNLLTNAAKYTEAGGHIRLAGERRGEELVVSVKDDGVGIGAEMLPRIFDIFSQARRVLERSQGGLGIGLSLVRELARLHGGGIEAHSEGPGRGSEFIVRLPVVAEKGMPEAATRREADEPRVMSKRRLLIVDDLKDTADSLAMLLNMKGHDVHTAYDGEEAIAAAAKLRPEVVLLDIGMPKLNGYDACRHIREQSWGEGVFIVALTGWGQEDDRRATEEAGFDHHMVKPVDPAALLQLLASLPAEPGSRQVF